MCKVFFALQRQKASFALFSAKCGLLAPEELTPCICPRKNGGDIFLLTLFLPVSKEAPIVSQEAPFVSEEAPVTSKEAPEYKHKQRSSIMSWKLPTVRAKKSHPRLIASKVNQARKRYIKSLTPVIFCPLFWGLNGCANFMGA